MIEKLKEELLKNLKVYIKKEGIDVISSSIEYAEKYQDVKDIKGNSYFLHILRTTLILSELHADHITIAASLVEWLPQQVEGITCEDITAEFGEEIGLITESL